MEIWTLFPHLSARGILSVYNTIGNRYIEHDMKYYLKEHFQTSYSLWVCIIHCIWTFQFRAKSLRILTAPTSNSYTYIGFDVWFLHSSFFISQYSSQYLTTDYWLYVGRYLQFGYKTACTVCCFFQRIEIRYCWIVKEPHPTGMKTTIEIIVFDLYF